MCSKCEQKPCVCPKPPPEPCIECGENPCICSGGRHKIKVELADGKERMIQHMLEIMFYSPDVKPISATQFIERLFGKIPDLFRNEDELRKLWSRPDTRRKLLENLEE